MNAATEYKVGFDLANQRMEEAIDNLMDCLSKSTAKIVSEPQQELNENIYTNELVYTIFIKFSPRNLIKLRITYIDDRCYPFEDFYFNIYECHYYGIHNYQNNFGYTEVDNVKKLLIPFNTIPTFRIAIDDEFRRYIKGE